MFWQTIHEKDQLLTLKINSWNSPITDRIWEFFSDIPVWIPMYLLIIGFVIWKSGWKKGLIIIAAALLTFGFCDQFSNFIKGLTERLRPCNDPFMIEQGLHILEKGGRYGFFSAHAANAFGLATSTFIGLRSANGDRFRLYGAWMFSWAALVGISRIFVGKHYLGDVIVGTIVGIIAGYVFSMLAGWIIRKFINK